VSAHDPVALENASRLRPDLGYASSVLEAAERADLVLHLTEWTEYRSIDPSALGEVVDQRRVIDARCVLDVRAWESAGWTVRTVGRSTGLRGVTAS
jgi:UDPglucose 6-dehydrogenase